MRLFAVHNLRLNLDIVLFIKGFGFGILVSAPLGPMGVLCIQRTINKGFMSGVVSGMGATVADIIYASVAGFGITIIANFLETQQLGIRAIGGIILIGFGIKVFMSNPGKQLRRQRTKKKSYISDFVSSFLITITNPVTVVVFGLAFASVGLDKNPTFQAITIMLLGVTSGALFWWLGLSSAVNIFRKKIRLRNLWWINKITGVLVVIFGIAVFISIFFGTASEIVQ